jgi:hypothetical protein
MMLKLFFALVPAMLFVLGCSPPDIQTEERPEASNQLVDDPTDDSLDIHVTPEISEAQLLETRLVKVGAAFHEFHEKFGHFPPAASRDAEGKSPAELARPPLAIPGTLRPVSRVSPE